MQGPVERSFVAAAQFSEAALECVAEPGGLALAVAFEQQRAHHRGGGQRDHQRDEDGYRQSHGEFAEYLADDATGEHEGNEYRHQRQAHGYDGESYLARTQQRRAHARHAGLYVARGVFHDDDGIIHDEAGGYGQRHQGEVVEGKVEQIHRPEGSNQRHRDDHGRNQRRAIAVQKDVYHQDEPGHGQHQRLLDLAQGGANRDASIEGDHQIDLRVDGALEQSQLRLDGVDHLDDIGAGLLKDR